MGISEESQQVILSFQSIIDISKFKHECGCRDFYIDRDSLTLVGTFSKEQLQLATERYAASCKIDSENQNNFIEFSKGS